MTDGTMMARLRLYQSTVSHSGERTTTAFSLVAWGRLAESLHRNVRRSERLFVIGELRIRTWKQAGINQLRPEIHLDTFHLLQAPRKEGADAKNTVSDPQSAGGPQPHQQRDLRPSGQTN